MTRIPRLLSTGLLFIVFVSGTISPVVDAQDVCCSQRRVKFHEIRKQYYTWNMFGIPVLSNTQIASSYPAERVETCEVTQILTTPPPSTIDKKVKLNITSPNGEYIHDGDVITIVAEFTNDGGATGGNNYMFDVELNGNLLKRKSIPSYPPLATESITELHTFDFDADTIVDPNDNSFRIMEIRIFDRSELNDEMVVIEAQYRCEIVPANPPGPIEEDTPEFPVCTTCGSCGTAGTSAFQPLTEIVTHSPVVDYAIANVPALSGCSTCNGSGSGPGNVPNSLNFERHLLPANQVTIGNSSPGMFFADLDLRLDLYAGDTTAENVAIFHSPRYERSFYLTDTNADGVYPPDDQGAVYVGEMTMYDGGGAVTADIDQAVTAKIKSHDCWEYLFDVVPGYMGCFHRGCRINTITSPDGFEKSFTYQSFTQTEINESPTRQYQVDTITDPSGNVATISYEPTQQAGRWVVSDININSGMVTLEYEYNGSGHLETVKRNSETIASYTYGTDTLWQAAYITWDHRLWDSPQAKDTIYISSDYLLWEGELVNQFADNLVGRADASGFRYMSLTQDPNSSKYLVESRGQLIEWNPGIAWRYFTTWTNSGSGGYGAYSGTLEDPTNNQAYSHHYDVEPGNYLIAQPQHLIDETGYSIEVTYDSEGNVHIKNHGNDYEKWFYDGCNRETYYRDREGYVRLTEYDSRGLLIRVSHGHIDLDGDGVSTPEPEAVQKIYGYYGTGHQNEGLLKWVATNAYASGAVVEPAANTRTDFEYNSSNQLTKIIKPLPQGETTRPQIVYSWVGGQVYTVTDEMSQVTTYNRDDLDRIEETIYSDGSKMQVWRDDVNEIVYTKDRNDIVSRVERDSSHRRYRTTQAYGKDTNILDENVATIHDWKDQTRQTDYFVVGRLQPWKKMYRKAVSEIDYDYRGRTLETRRYSGKYNEPVISTTNNYVNNLLFSVTEEWTSFSTVYSRTTYNGYSADRATIRKISTRVPTVTFADNTAVITATRVSATEPDYVIADAIRDLRGNLVQVIDGRGSITMNTFDAVGRQTQTVRGHGTSIALTSSTQYNARSNPTLTTDPAGMQVKTEYDDAGNVKTRTQAFGTAQALATSYTYDAKGRQKTVTAPSGGVTTSHYDDCCGNSSASEDAYGFGTVRVADAGGRSVYQAAVTDDFDFVNDDFNDPAAADTLSETTTRYFDNGLIQYTTRWKSARGQIDPANPPIAGVDGVPVSDGVTTQYVHYYSMHNTGGNTIKTITRLGGGSANVDIAAALTKLRASVAQGGASLYFQYNAKRSNSLAKGTVAISPDEKTMQVTIMDGLDRTVFTGLMTGPAASSPNQLINWTCTKYDELYNLSGFGDVGRTLTVDRDGNTTGMLTDGFGQTVGSLDPDDNLTRSKFDEGGSLKERTDANGNTVSYTYDNLGRQLTMTTPAGTTTTNYNATTGRVDSRVDAKTNSTSYVYDILGRQTTVTDRLGKDTIRTYDSAGRLYTLKDAQNKITTYTYDLMGRKLTTTYPDSSVVTMDYDPSGTFPTGSRATKMTYETGKSKTSITSFDGTLDKVEFRSTGGTLTGTDDYSYDSWLRRIGSTSADGIVRALTYDDNGQLSTDTTTYGGQSYTVTYSYDNQLRQNSITYPSGRVASYAHTSRGELDTISWAGTQIEDRAYDDGGRLTDVDRAYTDEVRTYDTSNRLLTIQNTNVGNATYTWDANSNKLSETWTGNMASWSFTTEKSGAGSFEDGYDAEDRFRRFIQSSKSNDVYLDRSDIGNIDDVEINTVSHLRTYSDAHELTNVDGTAQTFDDDGNQLTTHNGTSLSWSDANRVSGTILGTVTSVYKYDSDNKRVSKKVTDGSTVTEDTIYIYAGPNCIAEYQYGVAAASPDQEYVYGQGIDSLVLLSRNGNANTYTTTRNQQWSITALADTSNGNVQERYTYDHFGNRTILAGDGSTVRTVSSYNMPYGYTSRRHDDESELMYFRARYYDSSTGEFCSRDPLEYIDGMSLMRGYMALTETDNFGTKIKGKISINMVKPEYYSLSTTIRWQPFDDFANENCPCKHVGFYQTANSIVKWEDGEKTYPNGKLCTWEQDGECFGTYTHDDTRKLIRKGLLRDWNHSSASSDARPEYRSSVPLVDFAATLEDHPNSYQDALGNWNYALFGYPSRTVQILESCAVCVDKESPEYLEVFGCVEWGHSYELHKMPRKIKTWVKLNGFKISISGTSRDPLHTFKIIHDYEPGAAPSDLFTRIEGKEFGVDFKF